MSFEEEFDKIIRQKAEEANYPFDESNWEKTSRLLDAQQKVAKGIAYKKVAVSAFALLLVASATLGAWYMLSDNTSDTSKLNASQNTEQINTVIPQQNSETNSHQNNQPLEPTVATPLTKESSITSASPAHITALKLSKLNPTEHQTTAQSKQNNTNSNLSATQENPANTSDIFEVPETSAVPSSPVADQRSTETQGTNSANSNAPEAPLTLNSEPAKIQTQEPADQTSSGLNQSKTENSQPESIHLDNLELTYNATEAELYPTPFLMLMRYDDDYFKGRRPKTHYLNAEAGSTYLFGWDTKAGKDGQGFDWFAGLNYGLYLNKKFNASIGLQAYNIKNINQAFYKSAKTEYGFGSSNSNTVVTSNNLYYAAIPIKLAYAINSSNQIGLGMNVGYLFNSKNTVSTTVLTDGPSTTSVVKTTGVYQGTNTSNILLSVFYKKQLAKRFNVNAEFIYGATDIFKNTGNIKNIEKPMGLRLSLQYTLFDK